MKYLVIIVIFFSCTTPELKAQRKVTLEYEKKIGNLTFNFVKETFRGPVCLTLSNERTHKIDTVSYFNSVMPTENIIFDAYFTEDYFLWVGEIKGILSVAEKITKDRGTWIPNSWNPQIFTREELSLPHDVKVIDKNTLKVTKNGRNYLYKLDFANRRVDITEQN